MALLVCPVEMLLNDDLLARDTSPCALGSFHEGGTSFETMILGQRTILNIKCNIQVPTTAMEPNDRL